MTQVSEITERERVYTSQEVPKQSMLGWGLMIARVLLRNPGVLKKFVVMGPDEERYVRPPRFRPERLTYSLQDVKTLRLLRCRKRDNARHGREADKPAIRRNKKADNCSILLIELSLKRDLNSQQNAV
jgi:hypothetical protein